MKKTPKTIARSLTKALNLKQVEPLNDLIRELNQFYKTVRQSAYFKTLKSPLIKGVDKKAILEKTLTRFSLNNHSQALLHILALKNQMVDLPKIIEALKEIRLKDYKITEAEVITVTPLSSEQKNRAVKTLKKISGTDMILTEKINPSILGGLIFKLNDSIVDASLIRKIREMNKLLTA